MTYKEEKSNIFVKKEKVERYSLKSGKKHCKPEYNRTIFLKL